MYMANACLLNMALLGGLTWFIITLCAERGFKATETQKLRENKRINKNDRAYAQRKAMQPRWKTTTDTKERRPEHTRPAMKTNITFPLCPAINTWQCSLVYRANTPPIIDMPTYEQL